MMIKRKRAYAYPKPMIFVMNCEDQSWMTEFSVIL